VKEFDRLPQARFMSARLLTGPITPMSRCGRGFVRNHLRPHRTTMTVSTALLALGSGPWYRGQALQRAA